MDKQTQKNLINLVNRNYKEIAEHYSETRKKHMFPLWDELLKITSNVKKGDKVMDVGCGNGRLLNAFGKKEIEYLGVDTSKALLKEAKKLHPGKKFVQGDILELSKLSEIDFDYVFCIAVLHHLPGKDLRIIALKQLKNKVSDNGEIIISVWNLWSQKKFRKLIWKFYILRLLGKNKMDFGDILFDWKNSKGEIVSKRYYHAFTKRELKKTARKAGLKIQKIYKDKFNCYLVLTK